MLVKIFIIVFVIIIHVLSVFLCTYGHVTFDVPQKFNAKGLKVKVTRYTGENLPNHQ